MANYNITAPDGTKYQVTAPDDATQDQVMAYVQQQHGQQSNGLTGAARQAALARIAADQAKIDAESPQANVAMGNGVGGSLVGAGLGLVHHLANIPLGAAQLATNAVAKGADLVGLHGADPAANAVNNYMANREANYQAVTQGNVGSYVGAGVGEVLPWMVGAGEIRGATQLPEAATLGAKLANAGRKAVALSKTGALFGAVQPLTDTGNYFTNKGEQIASGAIAAPVAGAVGDAALGVGRGIVNTARLATPAGRDALANVRLAQMLRGAALTDVNGVPDMNGLAAQLGAAPQMIPGEQVGIAGALKTPQAIQIERALRQNANAQVPLAETDAANDARRLGVLQNLAGTDDALDQAIAARRANAQPFIDNNLTLQLPYERWGNAQSALQDALGGRISGNDFDALTQAKRITQGVRSGALQEDDALAALGPLADSVTSKTAQDAFQQAQDAISSRMVGTQSIENAIARQRLTALGQNPTVARALNTVLAGMQQARHATGKIPVETLDGIRRNMGRILADSAPANPASRIGTQEQAAIAPIEDAITSTLNDAVPGYSDYLAQYAKDSVPINTMEGVRGLLDPNARGALNGVGDKVPSADAIKAFLRRDDKARYPIDPAARAQIESVRDSIERANLRNVKLGTQGSDTAQLLQLPRLTSRLTGRGGTIAGGLVGGILGHATGIPFGWLGGELGGNLLGGVLGGAAERANADIATRIGTKAADSRAAAQAIRAARQPGTALSRILGPMLPYTVTPQALQATP